MGFNSWNCASTSYAAGVVDGLPPSLCFVVPACCLCLLRTCRLVTLFDCFPFCVPCSLHSLWCVAARLCGPNAQQLSEQYSPLVRCCVCCLCHPMLPRSIASTLRLRSMQRQRDGDAHDGCTLCCRFLCWPAACAVAADPGVPVVVGAGLACRDRSGRRWL